MNFLKSKNFAAFLVLTNAVVILVDPSPSPNIFTLFSLVLGIIMYGVYSYVDKRNMLIMQAKNKKTEQSDNKDTFFP